VIKDVFNIRKINCFWNVPTQFLSFGFLERMGASIEVISDKEMKTLFQGPGLYVHVL
jgi:hypothetical protein